MSEDLRQLMEEQPGGENHGRKTVDAVADFDRDRASVPLAGDEQQAGEFLADGGFTMAYTKNRQDSGLTAHRGVLHPSEHVDGLELQRLVEAELGFTYAQIRAVYRQGPLTKEMRELRGRIDARLLALRRSGGNLTELGRAIGFEVRASGHVRPFDRAIKRAKAAE